MSVSKSDSVRIAAPLFRALWAAASAAALVGCGGGGAEEPVDPATQEGPYLRDVAAGTSTLPRIDFPSTVSYVTAHDVQALLAADGRAVVRLQVAVTTRADGLVNHRELVYSRSTDGTWSAPETLDAPTAPETWHANDAGWVSTTVPAAPFDSIVRTDSDTRAMGTGIGQRLRSAPRHAVLPGQQRIGRLVDAQGNLYLIDRAQPTAPDTDWTVAQTRVSADGTVGLPQTVFKRNAVPHLTQNPTLTRAALFWDAPFIANQPIQWQVASLFIDTGTLFGSLPTGDPVHPNCAPPQDDMVTATPKWGTVMAYFHPDGNGGCERRVRVIDNRAPGVTAVSDRILDPEPQLATTSWWLSAGSEGQLLALWAKPTAETGRYEFRTAVGQVPDQNAVDRTWTW